MTAMPQANYPDWIEIEDDEDEDLPVREYEITASPNDFNVLTIFNFIESGAVKIPGFQRNYVWDIKRASKLIESLIIGLPIPQIFLYEEAKNTFLVIDGQQRLMSIYYFLKGRFPRKEKTAELRRIFDAKSTIPAETLEDDEYFSKFNLHFQESLPGYRNRLQGLNYNTLADDQLSLNLRPIRNIIIKQNVPNPETEDIASSSMFEIFNRLNSGGVNLTPQEIRMSLFHSKFYDMLYRLNLNPRWRAILGIQEPDLHLKDVEIILRAFAMLFDGSTYTPSMARFLNMFSRKSRKLDDDTLLYLEKLFQNFLTSYDGLSPKPFHGRKTGKFNISTFEAVFTAQASSAFLAKSKEVTPIKQESLEQLVQDPKFIEASQEKTTSKAHVKTRLDRAKEVLVSDADANDRG
jgi:Protein of unknown function DUF262